MTIDVGGEAARALLREQARQSLYFFARYLFLARRKAPWRRNRHHEVLAQALEAVARGEITRLILNLPPRYSKTELAVVNFIAWGLAIAPDAEFIHASYSARLATHNSRQAKALVESEAYRALFPHVKLRRDARSKGDWRTTAGGVVYATGAGGAITGFGAGKMRDGFGGAIIIDDPMKAAEADSTLRREQVIDWYQNTIQSRVNGPKTPIIVIMQRLHEEDLVGWLLRGGSGEKWHHISFPALDAKGQALWPEKQSAGVLKKLQTTSPYVFAAQYMQSPARAVAGLFKPEWWRYAALAAIPPARRIVQSWDTGFKTGASHDYSVCTTWVECGGLEAEQDGAAAYYLIDHFRARLEFPDLKRMAVSLAAKHSPHAVLIEDKASGQSLVQELRRATGLPIVAVKPEGAKMARAVAVTPLIEGGRVFLPQNAPWVAGFVQALADFPCGPHDDDVDSLTQALSYLTRGQKARGLFDYIRAQTETKET